MKFQDILRLFRPYRLSIFMMALFSLLVSLINAATPFVNSSLIDQGLLEQDPYALSRSLLLLLILQAASLTIQHLQTRQEILVTNALGKTLKMKALSHGLKLRPEYVKEHGFYKTIGDALFDIGNILGIASSNGMMIFMVICKAVGAAAGLLILDWRLTLLITPLIPAKIFWNTWMRKKAEQQGAATMEANKNYNAWFSDVISGFLDIKLWNLHAAKTKEYGSHTDRMNEATKNLLLLNSKNSKAMQLLEFTCLNLLYIPGAILIGKGQLSLGNLMTFLSFSSYLLIPVDAIMDLRMLLMQIKPNLEGIHAFFQLEEENYTSTCIPQNPIQTITFQNVCVTLGGREILKNVSFEVKRGEKIALAGENGCGKTTITNLLLGLCRPTSGAILVDGIPIDTFHIEAYRSQFGVVPQNIHLFRGTVRENISISDENAPTDREYPAFCTNAVHQLDRQFDTPVGSGGDKLSGGERQKIALLRALNRKAEILVLDEATSNYDRESENAFHCFIQENRDYGFYFFITHRQEMLTSADRILYLADGKLIQTAQTGDCT